MSALDEATRDYENELSLKRELASFNAELQNGINAISKIRVTLPDKDFPFDTESLARNTKQGDYLASMVMVRFDETWFDWYINNIAKVRTSLKEFLGKLKIIKHYCDLGDYGTALKTLSECSLSQYRGKVIDILTSMESAFLVYDWTEATILLGLSKTGQLTKDGASLFCSLAFGLKPYDNKCDKETLRTASIAYYLSLVKREKDCLSGMPLLRKMIAISKFVSSLDPTNTGAKDSYYEFEERLRALYNEMTEKYTSVEPDREIADELYNYRKFIIGKVNIGAFSADNEESFGVEVNGLLVSNLNEEDYKEYLSKTFDGIEDDASFIREAANLLASPSASKEKDECIQKILDRKIHEGYNALEILGVLGSLKPKEVNANVANSLAKTFYWKIDGNHIDLVYCAPFFYYALSYLPESVVAPLVLYPADIVTSLFTYELIASYPDEMVSRLAYFSSYKIGMRPQKALYGSSLRLQRFSYPMEKDPLRKIKPMNDVFCLILKIVLSILAGLFVAIGFGVSFGKGISTSNGTQWFLLTMAVASLYTLFIIKAVRGIGSRAGQILFLVFSGISLFCLFLSLFGSLIDLSWTGGLRSIYTLLITCSSLFYLCTFFFIRTNKKEIVFLSGIFISLLIVAVIIGSVCGLFVMAS